MFRKRMLNIRLLGDFSLSYGDQPVSGVNTPRLQSLLAHVFLHHDAPQSREHVAFLFWPDSTEAQARNNLRQLLHQLRQAWPDADTFLCADVNTLGRQPNAPSALDVDEFKDALAASEAAARQTDTTQLRTALERATAIYRGDLLPSCYDDWIIAERDQLRHECVKALKRLVLLLEEQRDYSSAIPHAQRLLRFNSLDEEACAWLMRSHALNGNCADALHVYQQCAERLRCELGVEPGSAMHEAYEHILRASGHTNTPRPLEGVANGGNRLDPLRSDKTDKTSLIGRQTQWAQLYAAWLRAAAGESHFVLITGEAGIGKTRLAEELLAWANRQSIVTARTRSYAAEGRLSLAPVAEWLRGDGLRSALLRLDKVWLTEVARILPELLTTRRDLLRPEPITEFGQRQRFFEALARAVLAAPQPLLLLIDDLQWCDQETLEWLHFLLRFDPSARFLIVGSARSEELLPQHPLNALLRQLGRDLRITEIALQALDAAETAELARQVVGSELDDQEAMQLFDQTKGNPLFIVETMHAGMSRVVSNSGGAGQVNMPPRVHAVIAGRLAQLSPPARQLAALAATIGHAFTFDLLMRAGTGGEADVAQALDELWQKRILRDVSTQSALNSIEGSDTSSAGYDFTHDQLRDVAYAEIGAPQRRLHHRHIARALEAIYREDLDAVSSEIAAHCERGSMPEQAIPYYQRAAMVAQRVYANEDAVSSLTRGLALIPQLPSGAKRDLRELDLQLALAPLYNVTKGWASTERESVLNRALILCSKVGTATQRAQVLFGLQSLFVTQGKLERVQFTSDQMTQLFQQTLGMEPPLFAGVMHAGSRLHLGLIREANEQFDAIILAHDPQQVQRVQESQGVNYAVLARAWQAHTLWCLGYPQQARKRGLEAISLAQEYEQPFNQALAATYFALLQQVCAASATAKAQADEALKLSTEYKVPYYRAWSAILASYASAWEQPEPEAQDVSHLRETIEAFQATGARLRLPYFLSLLAQVCAKAERYEDGLAAVEAAISESLANNEQWWDAELHRLRGELMLAQGADAQDVESAYVRAVEIAQSQQAKSLELRATTSLARLHVRAAPALRRAQSLARLSELYRSFEEGCDTPDLQIAQALIERR